MTSHDTSDSSFDDSNLWLDASESSFDASNSKLAASEVSKF